MEKDGQAALQTCIQAAIFIDAEPNACWLNAWKALLYLPGYFSGGWYVEGWLVIETTTEVQVIEHGWCQRSCGEIVDPTILFLAGDWFRSHYFCGLRISLSEVLLGPDDRALPVVRHSNYQDDGMGHAGYRCAYNDAQQEAMDRARRWLLPIVFYRMVTDPAMLVHITNE